MPTVEDYAPHAPFTLDELVVAANRILGNDPQLSIKDRTVRYYISERLLAPPIGGPKFARYGVEHLRRIVAIRNWLAEGISLDEARLKLEGAEDRDVASSATMMFMEAARPPRTRSKRLAQRTVRRIYLTRFTVLEVDVDADLGRELDAAVMEIDLMRRDQMR